MATIFSTAEARAFVYQGQTPLSNATTYPDALIEDAAERITEDFARICDVSFVPVTGATAILDGSASPYLTLPHGKVTAVSAVESWDGSAWVASGLSYRLLDDGSLLSDSRWLYGRANLRVTYSHGYAEPPAPVKRAALILAVNQLVTTNSNDRATQVATEEGTYNLSVAGWREHAYYGLPVVDSVLARYSARTPMVG
jgi:hypothetical protein